MKLENIIIPARGPSSSWDIDVRDGIVHTISEAVSASTGHLVPPSILLPALCHPHIHLDKAYILTCNHEHSSSHPNYSDLVPSSGAFDEALSNTSRAKERYTAEDLYLRGSQLIASSYMCGVVSMRVFVELDHVTNTLPLETAIRLKEAFRHMVEVQICVFAQDPIFSTSHGRQNREVINSALENFRSSIDALGTTPYVEDRLEASIQNIDWAITSALKHKMHLDFHLDYNLSPANTTRPLVYSVIDLLRKHRWVDIAEKTRTVVLGHCTQLTGLSKADFSKLVRVIRLSRLPIHFVGLPTSDVYMMGRPTNEEGATHARLRGTLQVLDMIKSHNLRACIGINNVGNPFTPFGTGDPLQLASWGVGLYQSGTPDDARILYGCISWEAKEAIGLTQSPNEGNVEEGQHWQPMLLIKNEQLLPPPVNFQGSWPKIPARRRLDLKDVVWDPPETRLREVIR